MAGTRVAQVAVSVANVVSPERAKSVSLFAVKLPPLDQVGLVRKATVALTIPFFALALSRLGMRRTVIPESTRTCGCDAIVAATALLPRQIAGIAMSVSSNDLTLAGMILELLMTTVPLVALNVSDSPAKLNARLFASPVHMMVPVHVASLILWELVGVGFFGAFLTHMPGRA